MCSALSLKVIQSNAESSNCGGVRVASPIASTAGGSLVILALLRLQAALSLPTLGSLSRLQPPSSTAGSLVVSLTLVVASLQLWATLYWVCEQQLTLVVDCRPSIVKEGMVFSVLYEKWAVFARLPTLLPV